jgi:[methyl-Co(III) methanol-specific corrinoid protein]:coenzyme M methyltransferase
MIFAINFRKKGEKKMATMTLKERFMNRLVGKEVDMTPAGCTTTYGVVDFMKKCGCERPLADTDPVAMTELAYAGHQYGGFEWVKAMGWDILPLSEAFGCELGTPKIDLQYSVKGHPFAEGVDHLTVPSNFLEKGRFPVYKENLKLLKKKVGEELTMFGESEGAFTCAANLVGTELFMKWCMKKTDLVFKTLEVTKQAAIMAANFAFDHGADYYVYAEPTSGPALLSPRLWEKFVLPVEKEIVSKVKGPVVLHICANTDPIIELMCETGVIGISIEEKADLKRAVEIAHKKDVKVFGNVATATTLFSGTPDEVYQESIKALENGTDFLCPGCGIAPRSPLENILQLKKARDDFFK